MNIKKLIKRTLGLQKNVDNASEVQIIFDTQGDYAESIYSQQFLEQHNPKLSRFFDEVVQKIEDGFGGWALSKSCLRFLLGSMDPARITDHQYCVVELGGGQSTLFWKEICNKFHGVTVITWEHNQQFIEILNGKVTGSSICVENRKLQQYTDEDWDKIFSCCCLKDLDSALISSRPLDLPMREYCNTRVHNVFYDISNICIPTGKIDLLVVDGPHGNGRSLAFAALAKYMKQETLIVIDDVSHYPFLEMLSKFINFKILYTSFSLNKQWIIVRVDSIIN